MERRMICAAAILILNMLPMVAGEDWNIECPTRRESLQERLFNSPFTAIVKILKVKKMSPALYNASAAVQCSMKGGNIHEMIEIIGIDRIVEGHNSPCHTLWEGRSYIVFLEISREGSYCLRNYQEVEYDPDNSKLMSRISGLTGLNMMPIAGRCPVILTDASLVPTSDIHRENPVTVEKGKSPRRGNQEDITNDGIRAYLNEYGGGMDFSEDDDGSFTNDSNFASSQCDLALKQRQLMVVLFLMIMSII